MLSGATFKTAKRAVERSRLKSPALSHRPQAAATVARKLEALIGGVGARIEEDVQAFDGFKTSHSSADGSHGKEIDLPSAGIPEEIVFRLFR